MHSMTFIENLENIRELFAADAYRIQIAKRIALVKKFQSVGVMRNFMILRNGVKKVILSDFVDSIAAEIQVGNRILRAIAKLKIRIPTEGIIKKR